ncbi:MAG: sulfite exporter TauE/SafE family protein [Porticoccaceae bacterium]
MQVNKTCWVLCFSSGRLLSYGLIGLLLGGLMVTAGQVSGLGLLLRTLAGLLLIGMGLYLANIGMVWPGLKSPLAAWRKVSAHASRWLPVRQVSHALAIGAIWGWLPCGLVYSTLAWAATTSSTAWESGLLMIAMGIGTLPAMLGISFFSRVLRKNIEDCRRIHAVPVWAVDALDAATEFDDRNS